MQTVKQVGEYKVKEIFNENGKDIKEVLKDIFSIYFMEEYFVEKRVRFIAVCDGIDTGGQETTEEMTQFKAFFNEWFLRDCSKKIKNGKRLVQKVVK